MALKIEMLRVFVAVARSGNLVDAAHMLNRTPSAVSMMLKQVEAHLGEPLFATDRKNKLTELGQFVLDQSEKELQHFDNTVSAIEGFAGARLGHVRIATVPSVAGTIIPQVISRHIQAYRQIRIDLRDMDSRSVLDELRRGRIDLGIATLEQPDNGLVSQLLMTDQFGVLFPTTHPLSQSSGPVSWDELADRRLISNGLSEAIISPASRALHAASHLSARNLMSILGMVREGIGVTLLPEMAARALGSSGLDFRPLADDTATRQIHLMRKSDISLSPAARRFERHILDTVTSLSTETAL